MRRFYGLVWSVCLAACGTPDDPCEAMCDAAAALYEGCLVEWGVSWDQAGFDGQLGFLESCDTWAWELRVLEEDAQEAGAVDAICRERSALFESGTCDDYTSNDWDALPWEAGD